MEHVLGPEISRRLHGEDWSVHQAASVRQTLNDAAMTVWVAESDGAVVGFAAARVADADRRIGEVEKIAVDPAAQNRGIGTQLTELATSCCARSACPSRSSAPAGTWATHRRDASTTRRPTRRS